MSQFTISQVHPKLGYPAVFRPIQDGGFDVSFPDFPGCVTFGRTFEEAHEKAAEILGLWLEELKATHQGIPQHASRPIITEIIPA